MEFNFFIFFDYVMLHNSILFKCELLILYLLGFIRIYPILAFFYVYLSFVDNYELYSFYYGTIIYGTVLTVWH